MYSQKNVLWHCKYVWNYNTDRQEISGQYLDNESVSGDTILDLLWRHSTASPGDAVLWRHNKSKMADGRHFEDR